MKQRESNFIHSLLKILSTQSIPQQQEPTAGKPGQVAPVRGNTGRQLRAGAVQAAVVQWLLCKVRKLAVWIIAEVHTLLCQLAPGWGQKIYFPSLELGFRSSTAGAPGPTTLVSAPRSIPWTVAGQIFSGITSLATAGTSTVTLLHTGGGWECLRSSINTTYCHDEASASNLVTCTSLWFFG